MAEKRVKVGKEFEHIPAVKSGRGWLGLEKGKTASVRFDKTKKKLELTKNISGKRVRVYFAVEDYAKANAAAEEANRIGESAGVSFGAIRKEERAALELWRAYVMRETMKGNPPRDLAEIMRELIEREEHKDETPHFDKAAFDFIEYKERAAAFSYEYEKRLKSRLSAFSKIFKGVPLAEITEARIFDAIAAIICENSPRRAPAPKTIKHYLETAKELFKWYYTRENATRRPAERLINPLELAAPPAIRTKDEKEPETLTTPQARQTLSAIFEIAPQLLPAAVFQLFCGVRNAEALRLRWKDLRGETLYLSRKITKTSEARAVPVPANALAWLNACRAAAPKSPPPERLIFDGKDTPEKELSEKDSATRARIESDNLRSRLNSFHWYLRKVEKALSFPLEKNVFRHTGASALAAIHGNARAADYCGHSKAIAGKHYRNPFSLQEAKDYFGIMPPDSGKPAIVFDRERKAVPLADSASESNTAEIAPAESATA